MSTNELDEKAMEQSERAGAEEEEEEVVRPPPKLDEMISDSSLIPDDGGLPVDPAAIANMASSGDNNDADFEEKTPVINEEEVLDQSVQDVVARIDILRAQNLPQERSNTYASVYDQNMLPNRFQTSVNTTKTIFPGISVSQRLTIEFALHQNGIIISSLSSRRNVKIFLSVFNHLH
jgi:hypothetical protein